ncbi:hypothetical protein [Pseudomonas sp. ACN5]|uniref:hypothetical protein n=1 Tax=Pseudomonas sp. ACN5 TaxID=1920427 RepID=UPI0011440DEE|nr:hypothetical protein [Pseudomonas sp. ACN5]PBJ02145.1 hypothetical protein BSF40_52440 [Pseudomonas sp. ACN5]
MTIYHTRIQHGVGQGSFHSASVQFSKSTNNHRFDYIYDCGALANWRQTPELTHSVRRLWLEHRPGSAKPVVDLLILSHFDWDHMNGASDLVERYEVDRIVLPYLGPVELAVILASQAASLDERAVAQLHSIAAGGSTLWGRPITMVQKGSREERPDTPENPDSPFGERPVSGSELPGRVVISAHGAHSIGGALERIIDDDQDLLVKKTSRSINSEWKIRFWNRGLDNRLGDLIQEELKSIGFPVAALSNRENGAKDIVAWLNVRRRKSRPKTGRGKKKAVALSSNRDLAVSAYRSAIDKYMPSWLNETEGKRLSNFLSLGMYSGPRFQFYKQTYQYLRLHDDHSYETWSYINNTLPVKYLPGWIGTGDAPLGEPTVWNDFQLHYKHELSRTQTILVPHHGAAPQSGPRFYNSDLHHKPNLNAVISYGTRNSYGHPHPSVLSQIVRANGKLIVVTEKTRFGFQEEYRFRRLHAGDRTSF